jgi:hypothetical protein
MRRPDKSRLFFFLGLLAIVILYSFYALHVMDPDIYKTMPRSVRRLYKFGTVLLVYAIGIFVYRKSAPGWLLQLWHIFYLSSVTLLLLLAFYDARVSLLPLPFRNAIITFHEFLISPIPYVIAGILSRLWSTAPIQ